MPVSFPPNMEHFRKIKNLAPSELPIKFKPFIDNISPDYDMLFLFRKKTGGHLSIDVSEPQEANRSHRILIQGPSRLGCFLKSFEKITHEDGSYTLKVNRIISREHVLMSWVFEHDSKGKLVSITKSPDGWKQERVFPILG